MHWSSQKCLEVIIIGTNLMYNFSVQPLYYLIFRSTIFIVKQTMIVLFYNGQIKVPYTKTRNFETKPLNFFRPIEYPYLSLTCPSHIPQPPPPYFCPLPVPYMFCLLRPQKGWGTDTIFDFRPPPTTNKLF